MCQVPEMKQKQQENAPLLVEQEQNLDGHRDLLLTEQERLVRVTGEEQADPLALYRERTAGMKDTAELGSTSFKSKTNQQKERNERIKEAKKLTSKATAYTLEIHTQLHDINEAPERAQDMVLLRSLEQYPFLPQMYVTSMIRANFREYVMLVRNFDYLSGQNKEEYAGRLERLAPVISALRKRLTVYCEQNRVTLAGGILSDKAKAAALTKEDIEGWYERVAAFTGQQQADAYDPDAASADRQAAEQHLQERRQLYIQAKNDREQAETGPGADRVWLEELHRQEQRQYAYYLLADTEAKLALAKAEGQDGEELRRQARETYADIRRLERRQAREEMDGGAQAEQGTTVRRTQEDAIATPSDQLSFQSRERLAGLNRELNQAGMADVAAVVERYVRGTRYRVGYTEERELLQAAVRAVKNALRGAQGNAAGALTAISEYFDQMTNGTLEVPANAEIRDFSGQRPKEEGTITRGSHRNAVIRGINRWSDQKDTPLFAHEPTVNDLKQRLVSNCYMVASTAGLVNLDPALLKECIRDNGDGTVTVRLYERQEKKKEAAQDERGDADDMDLPDDFEMVDDFAETELVPIYVKVTKEVPRIGGMDALSSGALWMQMIEKACAFVGRDRVKGYQSLWYGEGGDFLERLLGVSPEHVDKGDEDALFENICHAREQGFVYNTGTGGGVGEADGLNAGHAYTIMDGKVVNGEKYVLLRNPYSTHSLHYEDDGSKTRTGWLLSTSSDETYGQFYIKFEDFLKSFTRVSRTNINRTGNAE